MQLWLISHDLNISGVGKNGQKDHPLLSILDICLLTLVKKYIKRYMLAYFSEKIH